MKLITFWLFCKECGEYAIEGPSRGRALIKVVELACSVLIMLCLRVLRTAIAFRHAMTDVWI